MIKSEMDLWYEAWDRSGGQGLDTWSEPRSLMRHRSSGTSGAGDGRSESTESEEVEGYSRPYGWFD